MRRLLIEAAGDVFEALRARWAEPQNAALKRAGIEAQGQVAEVTVRREQERTLRQEERRDVVVEIRHVTRDEGAAERVVARKRRELARKVTGADRARGGVAVGGDRREQIGRAQAAAERARVPKEATGLGRQELARQAGGPRRAGRPAAA